MYELEAFLGGYASDFDVNAIIEEATVVDGSGNRYWKEGIDLNGICRRNERSNQE